jgi:hypothetical protein
MDFAALVFSVEASRHESRSALPGAEVQPCPTRAERLWAAVRQALSRAPAPDRAPVADRSPGASTDHRCARPTVARPRGAVAGGRRR